MVSLRTKRIRRTKKKGKLCVVHIEYDYGYNIDLIRCGWTGNVPDAIKKNVLHFIRNLWLNWVWNYLR